MVENKKPDEACAPFLTLTPPLLSFRDASYGTSTYNLAIRGVVLIRVDLIFQMLFLGYIGQNSWILLISVHLMQQRTNITIASRMVI